MIVLSIVSIMVAQFPSLLLECASYLVFFQNIVTTCKQISAILAIPPQNHYL